MDCNGPKLRKILVNEKKQIHCFTDQRIIDYIKKIYTHWEFWSKDDWLDVIESESRVFKYHHPIYGQITISNPLTGAK